MAIIRLTKEFSFEMAHALEHYDGACRHVHGHSYRFFVTVAGEPLQDANDPKCGMVLDFKVLKEIVTRRIIDRFDHAFVVRRSDANEQVYAVMEEAFGKVERVDYQPTCENLIADFARIIASELPARVRLHHLKLHETATSFAEWYAEDNR